MENETKIFPLHKLSEITMLAKGEDKKIAHCHGVFDLLHIGHIRHFEAAKRLADLLIVTITPDQYVNKGPKRPVFSDQLRAEAISALDCVDYVAINKWPTAVETIRLLMPHWYVKGPDYRDAANDLTGKIEDETAAIRSVGGDLYITDDICFSSSTLINQNMPAFDDKTNQYLDGFRKKYCLDQVLAYLEDLQNLKVAIIGESIIDEYVCCESLGKSGKESMLVMKYLSQERYAGGILAISNHLADFCRSVTAFSYLGSQKSDEEFLRQALKPKIDPVFIYKSESPTIVKRRFLDNYTFSKLFGVYEINDDPISDEEELNLCRELEKRLHDFDVVIIADYDHGLITPRVINFLTETAPYLAVNTQINAANIGYHAISKYRRADYVCIHEGEIRLDRRSRKGNLEDLVKDLANRLHCPCIMITRGSNGSLLFHQEQGFSSCPAFALRVVDRVGAGDAVFGLTSLMSAKAVPADIMGFVGNLVGADAVTIIGNKRSVDRMKLLKSITALLK